MSQEAIDKSYDVRKGEELDISNLKTYLKEHLPGFNEIRNVQQFPKGYSNLTYSVDTNCGSYVLRRPPFGANIKSAHDMGREFRVLSLLKPVYGKVPAPILFCEDEEVLGAPFYMMEKVTGVILRNKIPKGIELNESTIRKISEATIDNLCDLHDLDVSGEGFRDFGKPEGYTERQVSGWIRRYENARTDEIREMEFLKEWMTGSCPTDDTAAFIHNDYKYDNIVLNPENLGEITAVLDWEMATVGHPLMDLGTSLGYWAEKGDHPALSTFSLTSLPGNLTRQEVLDRYALRRGIDPGNFVFYYVYGSYKIAVICQQIYARYKKGLTQDERFGALIYIVKACAENGYKAATLNRISNLFST